jgi:hypothetical protein
LNKIFNKRKKEKLEKAYSAQKVEQMSDIHKKIENFRYTPCGYDYTNLNKRIKKN